MMTILNYIYSDSGFTSVSLKNPITMCFEKHKGQITSVQFSKFSRNIFLTSGSDGELRIYTLLQVSFYNKCYIKNKILTLTVTH